MTAPAPRIAFILALLFMGVPAAVSGCGGKTGTGESRLGDTHARSEVKTADQSAASPAAMTPAELESALADALARDDHARVLFLADRLAATGRPPDAALLQQLRRAADSLPASALHDLYPGLDPGLAPARLTALRLALIAAHKGDDARALTWLERAAMTGGSTDNDSADLAEKAHTLARDIGARQQVNPAVIAVLLPLSGEFARIGEDMAAAIRFAASEPGNKGARLVLLDTLGSPAGAVAAVDRAVLEHHALALLGPVGEAESRAAARRAAAFGVPVALLSPTLTPGPASRTPARVFGFLPAPGWDAREAARLAVDLGYDRLAVLAPRDEHGALATRLFVDTATAAGITVVATGRYDPTATDLEPDIKTFLGLDPAQNGRLRRHLQRHGRRGWKTFSPDVAFDLLYIPDEYDRAALVASYLPYFNVEVRSQDLMDVIALKRKHRGRVPQVVQLLGSPGWHHPSLPVRGGAAVDGALVLDIFAGGDSEEFATEEGARFAQDYAAATGRTATRLSAQAYDAALLVLQARDQAAAAPAPEARAAFAAALARASLAAGACGPAHLDPSGRIVRQAVILRVDGGTFVLHAY